VDSQEITQTVDQLVVRIAPTSAKRKMYGGVVFEAEPGNPKTKFCGYFVYAKHVGFEFSHGARLADPDGILEGKGKLRRHIRLTTVGEVESKQLAGFITQAASIKDD